MAVGDVVSAHASVNAAASQTIQPSAGVEWVLHNLYYGAAMELYRTDGTNDIIIGADGRAGCFGGACFHVTNTHYLKLKNASASAAYFGYDGVVTK